MKQEPRKINVVFLTDCLETMAGGAEKQIFELTKRLDKSRFSVTVASLECQGQASPKVIESVGGKLRVFPVKRIYGVSGWREGWKFHKFLKENKTDILQTYHFSSDIWGAFWGHLASVPVIISNRRDMGFWRKPWHALAYRLVNGWVNRIVVVAKAVKEMVCQVEGVPESKITVIYNGIELPSVGSPSMELREQLGIKEQDKVIVHVANLKPIKGHAFLVQAMKKVVKEIPHVKVLLIGHDELNGALQDLSKDLGLRNNILFLGKRRDVTDLLRLADICVLPSLSEGMSNAILEYMACGKPAVVTDVGGNPELVEQRVHGLVVPKENADELSAALIALLKDPELCRRMGENGLKRAREEFSIDKMVKNYEELFCDLFSSKKKVLHLISSGGLFGAEKVLLTIADCFQNNGFKVHVGTFQDARNPHMEVMEEARKRAVPTFVLPSKGRFDTGTILDLKRYLSDNGINVLHTHNYKSDIIGLLAAKWAGISIVATAHGFTDMNRTVGLYEKFDKFVLKFFDRVVLMTDRMLPRMPAGRSKVIANGINVQVFNEKRRLRDELRKHWKVENAAVIGTIGRLSPEKNHAMLIEAFRQMTHPAKDLKLFIVGEGPESEKLKYLVERHGLGSRVIFTGLIADIENIYPVFDIFVLSSLTEGTPLTILEAMAAEVPVIATAVGAVPQMIEDGRTGLLVEPDDATALAEKIQALMNDPGLQDALRRSALEHIKRNYSLARMCAEYRKIYEEVLNG